MSDVIKAVANANLADGELNAFCTVVDAAKCKMYMKNFGEFFNDQVENASCILLSHTDKLSAEKLEGAVHALKDKNASATVVTAPWNSLDGKTILAAMERKDSLEAELLRLREEMHDECDDPDCCCHGHHHEHHHEHEGQCCHGHHHEHESEGRHGHHHAHHHDECDDPNCACHHHEHGHHHAHHHADEIFTSWGMETPRPYTKEVLESALAALNDEERYGVILRAKGIVAGENGWLHFDYVPQEAEVRDGCAGVTGRICVIGCNLHEDALKELFK